LSGPLVSLAPFFHALSLLRWHELAILPGKAASENGVTSTVATSVAEWVRVAPVLPRLHRDSAHTPACGIMPMTEHRPYRTRTSVLSESHAPRAVILRRGPRSHHRQNVPIPRTVRITSGGRTRDSRMSAYQPTAVESERHVSIVETLQLSGLLRVDWTSLRREPDLLFAGDGCIFRLCRLCPRRRERTSLQRRPSSICGT